MEWTREGMPAQRMAQKVVLKGSERSKFLMVFQPHPPTRTSGGFPDPVSTPERETSNGCYQMMWKLLLPIFNFLFNHRRAAALAVLLALIFFHLSPC